MRSMLAISTIRRNAGSYEPSGYLYVCDGMTPARVARLPVPEPPLRGTDPNPRGGMRGARGIAVVDDTIFVANYSAVLRFDRKWRTIGSISHPLCADIHDIAFHEDRLWVTSTRNDLVFAFRPDGKMDECIDPWQSEALLEVTDRLGCHTPLRADNVDFRDPRTHDKVATDRLHLNSAVFCADGLRLSLGLVQATGRPFSAVLKYGPRGDTLLETRLFDTAVPSHNLLPWDNQTHLHLHSAAGAVLALDKETGASAQIGRYDRGFLRGLCRLDETRYVVGAQNTLLVFRFDNPTPIDRIAISSNPNESIHSIAAMPDDLSLTFPPSDQ